MKIKLQTIVQVTLTFVIFGLGNALFAQQPSQTQSKINAIFTKVRVDPKVIETVKIEIRKKIPTAHVRRIISGAEVDQTVMVMYHPKGNFRAAINDFFRVLDQMPGVISTQTYLGTTDQTPNSFPTDYLIGWQFVQFEPNSRAEKQSFILRSLRSDPDVLEVATLSGSFDLVVVYKFSGDSIANLEGAGNRIHGLIGTTGVIRIADYNCP